MILHRVSNFLACGLKKKHRGLLWLSCLVHMLNCFLLSLFKKKKTNDQQTNKQKNKPKAFDFMVQFLNSFACSKRICGSKFLFLLPVSMKLSCSQK